MRHFHCEPGNEKHEQICHLYILINKKNILQQGMKYDRNNSYVVPEKLDWNLRASDSEKPVLNLKRNQNSKTKQ